MCISARQGDFRNELIIMCVTNRVLDEFEANKKPVMDQVNEISKEYNAKQITLDEMEQLLVELGETYHEMLYELWKSLMTLEMQLFEQCEVCGSLASCTYHLPVWYGYYTYSNILLIQYYHCESEFVLLSCLNSAIY